MKKRSGGRRPSCVCGICRLCAHRHYMRAWRRDRTPWAVSVRAEAEVLSRIGCPTAEYLGAAQRILARARGVRLKLFDLFPAPSRQV